MSSFSTPMRLSRAARRPFEMRIARRVRKLLSGQPNTITRNPANAEKPSNWYRKVAAIAISVQKGA